MLADCVLAPPVLIIMLAIILIVFTTAGVFLEDTSQRAEVRESRNVNREPDIIRLIS
jgi:hypothetical protein